MTSTVRALALLMIAGCATTGPVETAESLEPALPERLTYQGPPAAVLEQHCYMGDRDACRDLGDLHLNGVGVVERSPGLAVALYLLACDQGDARACASAGDVYAIDADAADAAAAARCYRKACSLGHEKSCTARVNRRVAKKDKRR